MSTRSYILVEQDDSTYKGVYCHWDGYPDHNGALLQDFFNSREKAEEILSLGNLSFLQPYLHPDPEKGEHTFDYDKPRQEFVTIAYGRDRGEKGQEAKIYDLNDLSKNSWADYFYIYTKDDRWVFFKFNGLERGFQDLEAYLKELVQETARKDKGYYSDYMEELLSRQAACEM